MFDYFATRLAHRMVRMVHLIIRQEIRPMVDAVADLTAQTDATLAGLTALVTEIQKDVALLAAMPKDNTEAVEAQVARLKAGSDAAAAALVAAQTPPVVEQPAPTEPAPEQPAPEQPAPEQPAPEAPAA